MPTVSWPSSKSGATAAAKPAPTPAGPISTDLTPNWPTPSPSATAKLKLDDERDKLSLPTLMGKGRMLERSGEWDKARETYAEAMKRFPKDAAPYHRMGVVADQQRRYAEAEQMFSEAILRDPKNADQFNDLGYCYFLQGQLMRAESAMQKAVLLDPKNPRFQNNYGMVLAHQGREREALDAFRKAGSEADAQYNLAFVYATRDQVDQAKLCFRKAIAADPQHEASRKALQSFELYDQLPPEQRDVELASSGTRWVPYREPGEAAGSGSSTNSGAASSASSGASGGVQPASHAAATGSLRGARNAAQAQFLDSRPSGNLNMSSQRSSFRGNP